jgi:hypothetical protein
VTAYLGWGLFVKIVRVFWEWGRAIALSLTALSDGFGIGEEEAAQVIPQMLYATG